ncbi:unnamed protein product [Lota lota]
MAEVILEVTPEVILEVIPEVILEVTPEVILASVVEVIQRRCESEEQALRVQTALALTSLPSRATHRSWSATNATASTGPLARPDPELMMGPEWDVPSFLLDSALLYFT